MLFRQISDTQKYHTNRFIISNLLIKVNRIGEIFIFCFTADSTKMLSALIKYNLDRKNKYHSNFYVKLYRLSGQYHHTLYYIKED